MVFMYQLKRHVHAHAHMEFTSMSEPKREGFSALKVYRYIAYGVHYNTCMQFSNLCGTF